ncbi:transcriptional regulator [Pseudoroseomonas deserti]|uniref:Transcriptional regulator n=1 Tax=Teichococcus deserti TaxID=1817963 RepID=A0A1V2H4Q7_9PROT|nr:LysR family transcriptional regulator [Pseudoroseomonas deserti]ONG56011.1 transcriptional regulator [Pseudoroseomonas deserti]
MERLDCDRMFIAVLETGSFSAASIRLGTSSGQASKLVARLEALLGVQLIRRSTRALAPTELGQAYYERLRPLLAEFETLDASIRQASGAPAGRLRLSVPISFGTAQLTPLLLDFAAAYPGIELDLHFSDRPVSLVDEGFDAALRIGQPEDSRLIARRLCDIRVACAASPGYLAAHGTPATPADLVGHALIIDSNLRDPLHWRFAGDVKVAVAGRLRFSNAEACARAAEAGFGIARLPSFVAGPALRDGRLVPLLRDVEPPAFGLYALYPPARQLPLKLRVLVDFLARAFAATPLWDQGW